MCPGVNMTLKGQDGDEIVAERSNFEYEINSCEYMNTIRTNLGVDNVICEAYTTIEEASMSISVLNKVIYAFFDPSTFSNGQKLNSAWMYTNTTIMPSLSQVKRYFVEQTLSELEDNIWYNIPFIKNL